MSRQSNLYVSKRSKRRSFIAGLGAALMVVAATACVAVAVFIMLENTLPPIGNIAPTFGQIATAMAENPSEPPPPLWPTPAPPEPPPIPPAEEIEEAEEPPPPTPQPPIEYPPEVEYIPDDFPDYDPTAPVFPAFPTDPVPPANIPIIEPFTRYPENTPFHEFSFYIPQNVDMYNYFSRLRPDLPNEVVVWKVNSHLHLPFYTSIRVNHDTNPLMVNPFYRLPPGFVPHALVPVNNDECFLRATPETVEAFRRLRTASRQYNLDLAVTSAFRTAGRQAELFEAQGFRDGAVARPYHSEHQTGRALDLWGPGGLLDARGPSPTGQWVAANAHYHGFIMRYRAETTHITGYIHEPWHITYVGVDISMYMYVNNILSLEEYVGRNPGVTLPPVIAI